MNAQPITKFLRKVISVGINLLVIVSLTGWASVPEVVHAAGFPTTSVLDDFNRANQALTTGNWGATSWDGSTDIWRIISNQAGISASSDNGAYWTTAFNADQEVYCTVATKPIDGGYFAIFVRLSNVGGSSVTGYEVELDPVAGSNNDLVKIYRVDNDTTFFQLTPSITQEFADGDSFGASIVGSTITAYRKPVAGAWTSLGTRTSGTYTTGGRIGLQGNDTTQRCDDFGGGTVVTSTPAAQSRVRVIGRKILIYGKKVLFHH